MKVALFVAVVALAGATGLAGASVPLLDQAGLADAPSPPVVSLAAQERPVLVLDEGALPPLPSTQTAAPARAVSTVASTLAREVERVDRFPHFLLLPDGALMMSLERIPGFDLTHGVVLRETPAAPLDRPRDAALPHGTLPASDPQRSLPASEGAPARAFSPAGASEAQARAFDPRPASLGPSGQAFVAGGVAIAALLGLGVLLYHRIRPHAALENETRKVIFDAVCAQPGLGVHEISRTAGVSYSTATYHLERLVGAGMLVMTPDGNKLCYYKNGGAFSESERKILPLLKNEEAAKLFEAILVEPGTYRAALAEKLGVTATTINWHLRRLREAGMVDETRLGRSAHLYAKVDTLRATFLTLAMKVETSEPVVAQRLRTYAGEASASASGGVGAA